MNHIVYNTQNKQKAITETLKVLQSGGVVIFPSDTVYGLLCDATNEKAVTKLISFKNRPQGKAISIFVADFQMLKDYVRVDMKKENILKELLPGPFTIILNSKHKTSKLLESENGTLGVRIPNNELINNLVKAFGKPVTATSANLSGRPSNYAASTLISELSENKKALIDLIVDKGDLPRNKPSTVLDLTDSQIKTIREGDVHFNKSKSFVSNSAEQTEKLGEFLLNKYLPFSKNKPLVFIIEGELGAGKTCMVKGMGKSLGITNIISPTYVIYYEYGNFYHFDLYQIEDSQEYQHLGINKILKPGKILCFEWGEKAGEIIHMLADKAHTVYINIKYLNETERNILVKD